MSELKYWPYDEVTLLLGKEGEVRVCSPWLELKLKIAPKDQARVEKLIQKFSTELSPQDLDEINWFFRPLVKFPFCYVLPGSRIKENLSTHSLIKLKEEKTLSADWKWDLEGAFAFAQTEKGLDAKALFSVGRRYQILSFLENDKTNELYTKIKSLPANSEEYKTLVAHMLRQNHYVTARCDTAVRPALNIAQSAKKEIEAFIDEEHGHDKILALALQSMGLKAQDIDVVPELVNLLDLLEYSATKNFLAFAMIVNTFESSNYETGDDPLAALLKAGGFEKAAAQINKHMQINDSGGHENVALGFVASMEDVSIEYATEAFRIAELASMSKNACSSAVMQKFF